MINSFTSLEQLTNTINGMTVGSLREVARDFGIVPRNRKRDELIKLIIDVYNGDVKPEGPKKAGRPTKVSSPPPTLVESIEPVVNPENLDPDIPHSGILEIMPDGYGFVRTENYSTTAGKDYYVSATMIQRMGLRTGDKLTVALRQYPDKQAPSVTFIKEINDQPCMQIHRTNFDSLEACFPNERINIIADRSDYALRALDLVAPIGKGTRGLIVAPPKTGKTVLLKKIALAVTKNHPEIHLTVMLIDERPEEVTDFKDSVNCDVVYSTFDQSPQNHTRIAEMVMANARRRVEQGQDVMILLDSITRLGRAYNQTIEMSGRTLTGGLDISALQEPKKMFGSGRNVRGGGSLTILATALIETGSKLDEIVYEEFKGTGNMEIRLDRSMSERRIFPAIDLNRSGTRREDLLFTPEEMEGMMLCRRMLAQQDTAQATEELLEIIMTTSDNHEAIDTIRRFARNTYRRNVK